MDNPWKRCVGGKACGKGNRAASRTATAMRRRKGLVQVEVHTVDAEIGGPHAPDDRVEIRPVAIKKCARSVHSIGYLEDLVLEEAAGVRIGQHQGGNIGTELCFEHGTAYTTV